MKHKRVLIAAIATLLLLILLWLNSRTPESNHSQSSPSLLQRAVRAPLKITDAMLQDKIKRIYATPITFYGKIIDQHGDPVPDAEVKYELLNGIGGTPPIKGKSDLAGDFSIAGIHGFAVGVSVSKSGYRGIPPQDNKVTSSGFFEYNLAAGRPAAMHKETPAVFTLQKVGVLEPLTKIYQLLDLNGNGTPFEFSLDQQGGHTVIMKLVSHRNELPEGQRLKFNWSFEFLVPAGGLVKREDAMSFEAPEAGYVPRDLLDRPTSMPNGHGGWGSLETLSYFIRFNDGTHARVMMDVHVGDRNYITWHSYYNPKVGSRSLETAAKVQQ